MKKKFFFSAELHLYIGILKGRHFDTPKTFWCSENQTFWYTYIMHTVNLAYEILILDFNEITLKSKILNLITGKM
jgi:hypothetical protein